LAAFTLPGWEATRLSGFLCCSSAFPAGAVRRRDL
jgi:hypothetical protein